MRNYYEEAWRISQYEQWKEKRESRKKELQEITDKVREYLKTLEETDPRFSASDNQQSGKEE